MSVRSVLLASTMTAVGASGLNFLAVGDWGGMEYRPYTTPGQVACATKGMVKVAEEKNSSFVVALGDNFYFHGISTDENDARFDQSFDDVYSADALQNPWYVIAGNHDWKGNVSAQIEYSHHSERWTYPDYYHSHSFSVLDDDGEEVTVDIVLIDTVKLSGSSEYEEDEVSETGERLYFRPLPKKERAYDASQWDWIEEQLKASTAKYLLVGGHYPVYSVCDHGNSATLIEHLRPLLMQYGAHYLSGHDHCMEHLVEPTEGATTNYILTGMGMSCCYKNTNIDGVPPESVQWYVALNNRPHGVIGGFTGLSFTSKAMTVDYYSQNGNVLYSAAPVAPRF